MSQENTAFRASNARAVHRRYGAHPRSSEHAGTLAVEDGKLTIGGDVLALLPFVTSGCTGSTGAERSVVLLSWGLFQRLELDLGSAEEARALLDALGFHHGGRPMSFEVLTPSERPNLKALAINLGGWAILALAGSGVAFGVRALGYPLPRWAFTVLLLPLAFVLMGFMWRAYTTPLILNAEEFRLGRGDRVRTVPLSTLQAVRMVDEGVSVTLTGGEELLLKTRAAENLPDPVRDVLFGALTRRPA